MTVARGKGVATGVFQVGGVVAAAATLLALAVWAALSGSSVAPAAEPAGRVVILAVPRLTWSDLAAVEEPALAALFAGSAVLSVRAVELETTLADGYLTLGAGNRAHLDAGLVAARPAVEGTCSPLAAAARAAADDQLYGSRPGALGTALRAAGRTTAVVGSDLALLALMDADGCVDVFEAMPQGRPAMVGEAVPLPAADVVLVELDALERAGPRADSATRRAALAEIAAAAEGIRRAAGEGTTLITLSPAAPGDAARLAPLGIAGIGATPGTYTSASTGRAPYVTLWDLAPAVLEHSGVPAGDDPPWGDGIDGQPIRSAVADAGTPGLVHDRARAAADLDRRAHFRDRAVMPVSAVYVVAQVAVWLGIAATFRRRTPRAARLLRGGATTVAAFPVVALASGSLDVHRLPLDFYVVALACCAAFLAAIAVAVLHRQGRAAPIAALAAVLWLLILVDVATGARLQLDTPFGYSATVGGRFRGLGNVAFALVGTAAVVVATAPGALWRWPRGRLAVWGAWVGGVSAVVVAAPGMGADLGGTIAVVLAMVVTVTMLLGRRVRAGAVLVAGAIAAALVGAAAAVDLGRAPEDRTHLGRFARRLLDGEAGLIVRRKLAANVDILTASAWSLLAPVAIVLILVAAWRHRESIRGWTQDHPGLGAALGGAAVLAVVGFALNDSGIAIPAMMIGVVLAWVAALVVEPAARTFDDEPPAAPKGREAAVGARS